MTKLIYKIDRLLADIQEKKWFYKKIGNVSLYDLLQKNAKYAVQAYLDESWSSSGMSISGNLTCLCDKLFLTYAIAEEYYNKHKRYILTAEQKYNNDGITHSDDQIALWEYNKKYINIIYD